MTNAAPQWYERRLTHHDLDDLPEDDTHCYEVIDGELYVSSFPFVSHQRVATALVGILWGYLKQHPIGIVLTSNTKVVLDEPTGIGPDLVYIARAHLGGLREDGYYGAPDLMVEVTSSKPALDRVVKYRKYASAGVAHYWIVDPMQETLEAFELVGGIYVRKRTAKKSAKFSPKLFPGLVIPLAELWA